MIIEYRETIILIILVFFTLAIFAEFIHSFKNRQKQPWHNHLWKGFLLLSVSLVIMNFQDLINLPSPIESINIILAIVLFVYGLYFLNKGDKLRKNIQQDNQRKVIEVSKPVGVVCGVITLLFAPVSALFSAVLIDSVLTEKIPIQYEWKVMILSVVFGVVSIFLAIVGYRLLKIRRGWKGDLFSPYWLWPRIGGWLFLLISLIKLWQRNIQGLWIALLAIALLIISRKSVAEKLQI